MKTIRIELKQPETGATINLSRSFEDLSDVTELGDTVKANVLNLFVQSKKYGIKNQFKFSKAFELNIHLDGSVLDFKQSIFAELGLKGFKVVNTDKSLQKLASFIGAMVTELSFTKGNGFDEIATPDDVAKLAKKVVVFSEN
jgi:hypothetical protein